MNLIEQIEAAMDKAGRDAEYKAARELLISAEDGPERMEAVRYVGKRLGLDAIEASTEGAA